MPQFETVNAILSVDAPNQVVAEELLDNEISAVGDHFDYQWDRIVEVPTPMTRVHLLHRLMDKLDEAIEAARVLGLHEWEPIRQQKFPDKRPLSEAPRDGQIRVLICNANLTCAGQALVHLTEQLHAVNLRVNIEEGML